MTQHRDDTMGGGRRRHGGSDGSDEGSAPDLRNVDLFRGVPDDDLAPLEASAERVTFAKGQFIVKPGDVRDGVWGLVAGGVRRVREAEEGLEIGVDEFGPGDVFGLPFLGAESARDAFEATSDGTTALHVTRTRFRAFVRSHPDVALQALELLGRRDVEHVDRLEEVASHTVITRVAHLLDERAQEGADGWSVRLTQREIATLVASTRDPVARAICRLRELGLIETRRGHVGILVRDRQSLAGFQDEDA